MLVEVKGVQFVNKGAELMLHAVIEQLALHLPKADVVLLPGLNSPYKVRARLGALQKFTLQKGRFECNNLSYYIPARLRGWLQHRFGLVTEADIDLLLDASGFAYGDQWPDTAIVHLAAELKRYARGGKPYIFLPQAFGPFSRAKDRRLLAQALPLASLICARDQQSYDYLAALLPDTSKLVLFPDFTNLVSIDPQVTVPPRTALIIPNANMLSAKSAQPQWLTHYIPFLIAAARELQQLGYQPVFLNHEGAADQRLIEQVLAGAGVNYPVWQEPHPVRVKSLIAGSALVLSSRFHGCVSALSQGVPCIGTSWSHKYQALFADYLQSDALIEPDLSMEQLRQLIDILSKRCHLAEVVQRRDSLKQQSLTLWQRVFATLQPVKS